MTITLNAGSQNQGSQFPSGRRKDRIDYIKQGMLYLLLAFGCFPFSGNAQKPTITSISPASGTTQPGTAVTLTGTNFNTTAANNIVYFGATKASVTAATATSLSVTAPLGATYAPVTALNTASALVGFSPKPFLPTFAGKGSFTVNDILAKVNFASTINPSSVAIGDLDRDGKSDLVVANHSGGTVSVFRNTSASGSIDASSFAAQVDFSIGGDPKSVAIGDLDGDGKPDLAVVNGNGITVSVLRNKSVSGSITTSSFAAKVAFSTGLSSIPYFVAIGDLDGDGKPDLAVANKFGNSVSVFHNTSVIGSITTSSFAAKVDFPTGVDPEFLAIGDLDGDGKADLAVTNITSNTISIFRNTSVSGSITTSSFAAKVNFTTGAYPRSVAIGDLDGDGKPDLVVTNSSYFYPEMAVANNNTISIFRNKSVSGSITTSSFAAKVDFTTGAHPRSVAIGDLDGDGKPDLAVANTISNTISIFRNISVSGSINASSFAAKVDFATGWAYSVAIGDLDGDGMADLAVTNYDGTGVSVFRNNPLVTITFNANGGSGTMANQTITLGVSANLTSNAFTRAGYTFAGWATSSNTPVAYADDASYTLGDATLYAQWTLTVNYDSQGGSAISSGTTTTGGSFSASPGTPTRTGYTFNGWFAAPTGGTAISFPNAHGQTANFTLYAQWSINDYTITYDGNGSSAGSMSAQTNPYNTIFNLTANGFTRTGYVFYGWNTAANGGGTAYANSASYTMGASDVTLYAQWIICTWTGASNGDWNDASNWSTNQVPSGGIDVVIPAGTVNAISTGGSFSSKSVSIQAGATVSISSSGVWNIVGNLQGEAGSVITGTGKVLLNGSSAQNIEGTVSVSNLEIGNNAVQIASGSSLSILPTASSPNALLILLSASSLTNNGNLILRSNSFGTGSIGPVPANATLVGNITQERLMPSTNGWYFAGAPVKSSTLTEWSELNTRISPKLNASFFEYSETDSTTGEANEMNGWKVPNTLASAINPSNQPKGYRIHLGASNPTRLASVTGLPFVQDVNKALTFSPTTGYAGGGWNLISNPYPCAINWNQMRNDAANSGLSLSNAYYNFNGVAGNYGTYTSLNASTGVGVGGLQENIPSSQAFFVKANGAGNLAFKESFKNTAANSASFLRTATTDLEFLKFKVQQGSHWDEAGVLFYPSAGEGLDNFDALNLIGSAVDLATVMADGKNAAIEVLPQIGEQRIIPLKVQTPANGTATFSFEGIQNFPSSVSIYLKDDFLGSLINIRQNPELSFESDVNMSQNRFSLIIAEQVLTETNTSLHRKTTLHLYPNPAKNQVVVYSPASGILEIFNAMGQRVKTLTILNGQNHLDISSLPKGMYQVRMEGLNVEKLIVE